MQPFRFQPQIGLPHAIFTSLLLPIFPEPRPSTVKDRSLPNLYLFSKTITYMSNVRELHASKERKFHPNQIVTIGDLEEFKTDLLLSIRAILSEGKTQQQKKWLKSYEVKKILNISAGTLQTLRANGTLPFSKIGGIIYYDADEINRVLETQKRSFSSD